MTFRLPSILIELTKTNQTLSRTKKLHALIVKTCLSIDPFYATKLIRFYAINHDLCSARHLFDKTPQRSVFLWNSIIRAYAQAHKFDDSFLLFAKMLKSETMPDNFTFACMIRACLENFDVDGLRIVHGGSVVSGFGLDSVCSSALVTAYSKLGRVEDASNVFNGIPDPDLVLYNSMISGYGSFGLWDKGLELFRAMRIIGKRPDGYTLVGLISALADSSLLHIGKGIHGFCLKSSFDSNAHIGSMLVSMYSRFKCLDLAHRVFTTLFQPDLVTWSAVITGFSQSGEHEKSLLFFKKLNMEGKKADPVLVASVLAASAHLANLGPGIEIHGYVLRHGYELEIIVSSALIDMYSKCGFIGLGIQVFEAMSVRNIVSYNSAISGLGLHGLASQAFAIFEELQERGFKPDESTFSGLLSACCHAGLVKDGKNFFKRMKEEFGMQARAEHYVHMIKLLGMAGELEDAYNLILSLPEAVDSSIWGALLSCCDILGNTKLAETVAHRLFESRPQKSAYRVMLSNIYAGDGRWDDVKNLREDMVGGRRGKSPGLSWIGGCTT